MRPSQSTMQQTALALLLAFSTLSAPALWPASAEPGQLVGEIVGQIGGAMKSILGNGDFAYVGMGLRLAVLDVSDKRQPVILGQTERLPDVVQDIELRGGLALTAADQAGMRIITVREPSQPREISFAATAGPARALALDANQHVYVACAWAALRIFDVSNPGQPVEIASCPVANSAEDVLWFDGYALVADGSAGLSVIDVHNPAAATPVGTWDTPG